MNKNHILIITGGTGGHVIPSINLGNYIIEKGNKCYLLIDKRGRKYSKSFKGEVKVINSSHFSNNFYKKILAILFLIIGFFQSFYYLLKLRPKICISFGSYATFIPTFILVFFRWFGITKIFLHEQNSVMGRVNIFFSPFSDKIFLNYKNTKKINPSFRDNFFYVGMPQNHKIKFKKRKIHFNNKKINVFICGGSQGAESLNKKIMLLLNNFPKKLLNKIYLSIQCSKRTENEIKNFVKNLSIEYELKNFYNNFIEKLVQTDVLISRAGAGTVHEVIITQTPTIFVPLPTAANNHQYYNADYLKKKNAAILIEQDKLNTNNSYNKVLELISNRKKQENLTKKLQEFKNFDTNKLIFDNLYEKK